MFETYLSYNIADISNITTGEAMEKIELQAENRETLGKKVRFLRRQGVTPVHLFGHGIKSESLQCDTTLLRQVMAQAGKTNIINLKLDKGTPRIVVVRHTQKDPQTGELLHVDFYQVRMDEKIQVEIPIILFGEPPALKLKENMIEQELHHLTVESLPDRTPPNVEIDVSSLAEKDQAIHVRDITLGEGVTILNDPEHIIVKVSRRHIETIEEVLPEEEELVEEEAAEGTEAEAQPAEEKAK